MLPSDLIGLVLLLAALAPGYVYVRVAERYRSRPDRSALLETAEVLVIGAACTTLAALALIAFDQWVHGVILDTSTWTRQGNRYLRERPDLLARSIGLVLVGASLIAWAGARIVNRGRPSDIATGISIRAGVFEPAGRRGNRAWVAIHLKSGSIVEGYLLAYPTGDSDRHEIALQKPIGLTGPDQRRALVAGVDRVVVSGDEITMIGVRVEDD